MSRETNTYYDHLPILWHIFLWYAPIYPLIMLLDHFRFIPPFSNDFLFILILLAAATMIFTAPVCTFFYDAITTALYVTALVITVSGEPFSTNDVRLIISATVYFIFVLQFVIPDLWDRFAK